MVDRDSLRGRRILVPPARAEGNPLADLLRRAGAAVVEFPSLAPRLPSDLPALDRAVADADRFDWVLFSGGRSVEHFFARRREADPHAGPLRARIATLGGGARAAARANGHESAYHPPRHTAEEVASGWPLAGNASVLLVRAEGATDELPLALAVRRARVVAVAGYGMDLAAPGDAGGLISGVDTVAFANGTAVRHLAEGLARDGLGPEALRAARVAAVGEATARAARASGFRVDAVADGGIAGLAALVSGRGVFPAGA